MSKVDDKVNNRINNKVNSKADNKIDNKVDNKLHDKVDEFPNNTVKFATFEPLTSTEWLTSTERLSTVLSPYMVVHFKIIGFEYKHT